MPFRNIDDVRRDIIASGKPYFANDNIAQLLAPGDVEIIQAEVERHMRGLLNALMINTTDDHNTQGTAHRVAKMYVQEVFSGRYTEAPTVTDFPNAKKLDEIYTLGPITVRSACSHHFVPITGSVWIGVIPSERVIGISKFARIAQWVMGRPQIQEEAVIMLADTLERLIQPKGLAVVVKASHMCMTWRGIRETDTTMVNSVVRGLFMDNPDARSEFFSIINSQGF